MSYLAKKIKATRKSSYIVQNNHAVQNNQNKFITYTNIDSYSIHVGILTDYIEMFKSFVTIK